MSKGNPDISMDIHTAILLILRGEKSVTQAVADIMRIPLEQVVDGSVYQFELVRVCGDKNCKGYDKHECQAWCFGINGCTAVLDDDNINRKLTKRISHYDLADAIIAEAYVQLTLNDFNELSISIGGIELPNNKGTIRAIKTREVV